MDEIERSGFRWRSPGAQPEWPPLTELGRNLYSFREEVIRSSNREFMSALLRLDYALLSNGLRRLSPELFTVGLDGYRWNYEPAERTGDGELREMFRDRPWSVVRPLTFDVDANEVGPYVRYMVQQQERLLSHAMHADRADDYQALHRGFRGLYQNLRWDWDVPAWPRSETTELYERLGQQYRIALLGLGGLCRPPWIEAGRIAEANPYVNAVR